MEISKTSQKTAKRSALKVHHKIVFFFSCGNCESPAFRLRKMPQVTMFVRFFVVGLTTIMPIYVYVEKALTLSLGPGPLQRVHGHGAAPARAVPRPACISKIDHISHDVHDVLLRP